MMRLLSATALGLFITAAGAAPLSGVEKQYFDPAVAPGDDFYRHVNGQWLASTDIPADKSNYSAFSVIADDTQKKLLALIRQAADSAAPEGSLQQKIGDMYASFMDEARVNALGLEPLQADLLQIERLANPEQIPALMAMLDRIGVESLIGGYISRDAGQPDAYIIYLYQSGLGLPDREYYLADNKKFASLRRAYQDYVADLLRMAGTVDAADYARQILKLETALATAHWTKVASRDAEKTYNRRPLDRINDSTPQFDLAAYLDTVGVHSIDALVLSQPSYFEAIGRIVGEFGIDVWREYFRLRLLDSYAPVLSQAFVDRHFDFHGRSLFGIAQNKPRWKRGVDAVEDSMGELLGQLYVEAHFSPESKQRMQVLVDNLIRAYRVSIQELEWMSPQTKAKALEKLAAFRPKIGYPDRWRDYSALRIAADDLAGNVRRARQHKLRLALAKLGGPIDPHEWHMTPQTVNAYYNPTANEIVFPAAILQPPFFNPAADDAVNYGGIGAVIGHEIGHGFDDQGSRYDGDGRLRNWWTDEDRARFEQRTGQLIQQYDGYEPLPGYHVNGELTIGENIGDLGGLSIAAKAYRLSLNGKPAPVLDGYTGMQRLLIGWAQIWRRLYREEALINRLKTDPHSPGEYRCNGIVSNVPEFYEAFDVKPGDAMYLPPEKRVKIW